MQSGNHQNHYHRVLLRPTGRSFAVGPDESPLNAGLRQGVALRYGCRRGRCSSCKYRLIEGEVDFGQASPYSLSESERQEGWVLMCCARARSDLVVFDPEIDTLGQMPVIVPGELAGVVRNLERIASTLWRLHVKLAGGIKFYPGQFIEIGVPWAPGEWRSYSIASPPSQAEEIELIIKRIEHGLFSGNLDRVVPGLAVNLRGPFGTSYLREGESPVLMVAAGSGIAPLLSMIRHAGEVADPRPFTLFYGARTRADLPVAGEIAAYKPRNFNFEVTLSAPTPNCQWNGATGWVSKLLQHSIGDASPYDAYLCGAPEMCDAAELLLSAKGINEGRVFADRFYATSAADGAVMVS